MQFVTYVIRFINVICFIYVIRAMLYSWFVPWIYVLGGGCFIMCAV